MAKSKFKRAFSVMLSSLMLMPLLSTAPVSTVSAAPGAVIAPMTDLQTASKVLEIYNTEDVTGGVNHGFGANVGAYKFDAAEGALLLKKSSSDYMGGYYRFHVMPPSGKLTNQSWMIISYKTNTSEKAKMVISSNSSVSSFTLANDVSVSKNEYVWTEPVNVSSATEGDVFARLQIGYHCALVVDLPKDTPDSTYFYIKEISFFASKEAAENYIESGALPEVSEDDTPAAVGTGQFVGSTYTYEDCTIGITRVYAAGDSMGGGGTWDLILREPDLLAAALPVCGYNDPSSAINVRGDIAIWAHHTMQDKTVNVKGDRAMTATLKNLGNDKVFYTEYDSSNPDHKKLFNNAWESSSNWEHWTWEPAYNNADVIEWLVSQKKSSDTSSELKSKFTDIKETDKYCKAVNYVAEIGLFMGMTETEFAPNGTVTREQFVTVLGRYAGVDVTKYTGVTFPDVDTVYGTWYAPYVEWAAQNSIVQGIGDGKFGVGTPITIQQACTILSRFVDYKAAPNDTQLTLDMYSDKGSVGTWAVEGMQWAISSSIHMGKMGDKMYLNPTDNATRAQIAQMFYSHSIIFGK